MPPELDVPDAWHRELAVELQAGDTDLRTWWTLLGDSTLIILIERGAFANRSSERTTPLLGGERYGTWQLGADAIWEVEAWGRVTRLIENAILDGVNANSAGCMFITLKPWADRADVARIVFGIAAQMNRKLYLLPSGFGLAFPPPPIMGLGNAGGFDFRLQARQGVGISLLETVANDIVVAASQDPQLTRMNTNLRTDTPQVFLDIDREKVKRLRIPLQTVFETLQANLGSAYVNDFNLFGRTYKVMAQADARFRGRVEDVLRLEVRSTLGEMIPLSTLLSIRETAGPRSVFRYNKYASATITGTTAPGVSSGQAIAAMQRIATATLPESMGYEWSGISYQEIAAGNAAPFIFAMALIFVFLFLAARYESWSAPLAVLLNIPVAILGALALTFVRQLGNNVPTRIGFVLLIGPAARNAIMIVEFAREEATRGSSVYDAAMAAARLRFRAILMTALSFLLGVIPLVVASGAGANSRQALGTAVFGGMLLATCVGILMIPLLYVFVARVFERRGDPVVDPATPAAATPRGDGTA